MKENGENSAAQAETEAENSTMVVDLVQSAFRQGKLAEESMWQAVALIPRGRRTTGSLAIIHTD